MVPRSKDVDCVTMLDDFCRQRDQNRSPCTQGGEVIGFGKEYGRYLPSSREVLGCLFVMPNCSLLLYVSMTRLCLLLGGILLTVQRTCSVVELTRAKRKPTIGLRQVPILCRLDTKIPP